EVPATWYEVRKKIDDIRHTLPAGVVGPFFNDEFGDTFGNIYALAGTGFDYATLREFAERLQLELQRVPDVAKVQLLGLQDERIWIELDNAKLATLGVPMEQVRAALEAQNAVVPAGFFETPTDRVYLRVSGSFDSPEAISEFAVHADGRSFRIGDVATVRRGFSDPPAPKMRFMGQESVGLAVSMQEGGAIVRLGEHLQAEFTRLQDTLPIGMTLSK